MNLFAITLVRIRHDGMDTSIWTDSFCITAPLQTDSNGFLALLKHAVKAFLETDAGKDAIDRSCNDFNWGDAVQEIPSEFWAQYNIRPIYKNDAPFLCSGAEAILVNQDEVLC